jgi:GNAT superfamily N-acetyltransferase
MAFQSLEFNRAGFTISTDPDRLDLEATHAYLANDSYWAAGIPFPVFRKSVDHSLCFGVYHQGRQIGFARVISDFATFAYLADVFILDEYQGQGLGKWLVTSLLSIPELQGLRRWMLVTRDAHELYARYGFTPLAHPEWLMEIAKPDIYKVVKVGVT